jgi:hypothetical protein
MADYIDNNVKYTGISQVNIETGNKISRGRYHIDNNGFIVNHGNIINAIDIDWNNATIDNVSAIGTNETDKIGPIKSTTDLLTELAKIRNRVQATIPRSISDLIDGDTIVTKGDLANQISSIVSSLQPESAYDIAKRLSGGTIGTEEEWIASLKGKDGLPGATGPAGKSAFEIAKQYDAALANLTEQQWIASLKGAQGVEGKSAYDIAVEHGYTGTEAQWIEYIENNNGDGSSLRAGNGITIENGEISATANTWINVVENE